MMLVRDGAAIPHLRLAQSTAWMDWGEIELVVYGARSTTAEGLFCLPEDGALHSLRLVRGGSTFVLRDDPLTGKVDWNVRVFDTGSRRDA